MLVLVQTIMYVFVYLELLFHQIQYSSLYWFTYPSLLMFLWKCDKLRKCSHSVSIPGIDPAYYAIFVNPYVCVQLVCVPMCVQPTIIHQLVYWFGDCSTLFLTHYHLEDYILSGIVEQE